MSIFYKTNHPEVIAAVEAMKADLEKLFAAGKAFGESFGGKPLYSSTAHGRSFAGLVFKPARPSVLWTIRDRWDRQNPRKKPRPHATPEQREEHAALLAKWTADYPKQEVSYDAVLKAMGTDWGSTLFAGIGWFEHDGWFYVETSTPLNDRMTEILGSEHKAAKAGAK